MKFTTSARIVTFARDFDRHERTTARLEIASGFGELRIDRLFDSDLEEFVGPYCSGLDVPLLVTVEIDPESKIKELTRQRNELQAKLAEARTLAARVMGLT